MARRATTVSEDAKPTARSPPEVSRIIKFIRKVDRLFRIQRLTTRSSVNILVLNYLGMLSGTEYLGHDALRDPDVLAKVYEESRVLDLYQSMLLDDNFFSRPPAYIGNVFSGLGMIGMNTTSYQLRDTADRMVHRAPSMWKHLWVHRRSLLNNPALSSPPIDLPTLPSNTVITYPADLPEQLDPTTVSQQLKEGSSDRLVLILLMYGWAGLYKMRPDAAVSPYHRHVALYYWTCMTPHIDASTPNGDTLRPVMTCLQNMKGYDDATRDALVREVFARGSGVDPAAYCERLNQLARRISVTYDVPTPKLEDQTSLQILSGLQDLACHPLLLPFVTKHRCHEVYVGTVSRLVRPGTLSDPYAEFLLWHTSHVFTHKIQEHLRSLVESKENSEIMRILSDFFRGDDLIEQLACGIDVLARRGSNLGRNNSTHVSDRQLPIMLIARMQTVQSEIMIFTRFGTTGDQPFLESMKRAARERWWPALRSIQKAVYLGGDHISHLKRLWLDIGAELGLDEQKEQKRHEREAARRCAWAGCTWHWSTPDESVKLKMCQGCGEVRYCGRECQKTDWNRGKHKEKCRHRLKESRSGHR